MLDYLALHGIEAQPAVMQTHEPVEECLSAAIAKNGITLLVMGAYTRGRVRQMLFGGMTQKVLTTPGVPALLAH